MGRFCGSQIVLAASSLICLKPSRCKEQKIDESSRPRSKTLQKPISGVPPARKIRLSSTAERWFANDTERLGQGCGKYSDTACACSAVCRNHELAATYPAADGGPGRRPPIRACSRTCAVRDRRTAYRAE